MDWVRIKHKGTQTFFFTVSLPSVSAYLLASPPYVQAPPSSHTGLQRYIIQRCYTRYNIHDAHHLAGLCKMLRGYGPMPLDAVPAQLPRAGLIAGYVSTGMEQSVTVPRCG